MEQSANRSAQQLARKIRRVADKNRRAAGLVLPFFDEDPEEGDPTNMWALPDDRIHVRMPNGTVREIVLVATTGATSAVPLPVEADLVLYEETYTAIWGRTFCDTHGIENTAAAGYGVSSAHGQRRLMVGFDHAAIAADLDGGAVVRSVELSMINLDVGGDANQITVTFGVHNTTPAPAAYAATRSNVWGAEWPRTGLGDEWRQPDGSQLIRVVEWIRGGIVKGLTVDQTPAGELDWASIRLKVGFTK